MNDFEPIHIDLRNLSQEHLAQCKPNMTRCDYTAPCVIGTLIPPTRRGDVEYYPDSTLALVEEFIDAGVITIPADQRKDVCKLQRAFDGRRWDRVLAIASKYIAQGIEAQSDETPQEVRPEGREPDRVADAPATPQE